ncbi:MAG: hypothetical protein ACRD3N_15850 [Terracidiphilus sp.]
MSVFLYHHAAAIPPRIAEAAANSPMPSQPEEDGAGVLEADEVPDSKEFVISDNSFMASPAILSALRHVRLLDAGEEATVENYLF